MARSTGYRIVIQIEIRNHLSIEYRRLLEAPSPHRQVLQYNSSCIQPWVEIVYLRFK